MFRPETDLDQEAARRAREELEGRPRADVLRDLEALFEVETASEKRGFIVRVLGELLATADDLPSELHARYEAFLHTCLGDGDDWVRIHAVTGLLRGFWGVANRSGVVHDEVIDVLRDLLVSAEPDIQWGAALSASRLGDAARNLVPELLAATESDDALVRCSAVGALGQVDSGSPAVLSVVQKLMSDPDELVRGFAVASAGADGLRDPSSVPLLSSVFEDPDEVSMNRASAADSLARLPLSEPTRARILDELLDARALFEYQDDWWVVLVGRFAAGGEPTAATDRAQARLESIVEEGGILEGYAAAALALIACQDRDLVLAMRVMPTLREALDEVCEELGAGIYDESNRVVVEAAIDLECWFTDAAIEPFVDLDLGRVEDVLRDLLDCEERFIRTWAAEQLARLP
jgi:HEAT repeat protein